MQMQAEGRAKCHRRSQRSTLPLELIIFLLLHLPPREQPCHCFFPSLSISISLSLFHDCTNNHPRMLTERLLTWKSFSHSCYFHSNI